jgi:outer membrane protein
VRFMITLVAVAVASLASVPAQAEAGDILIKTRGTYSMRLDDFIVTLPDADEPVGANVVDTPGAEASLTMFVTDHLALEFSLGSAGYEVEDDSGRGLVSANLLMSTATIQYHFAPEGKVLRPYLGVGLTHLNLYSEEVETELLESSPDPFIAYNSRLTGGFAPVAQVGADIAVNERLYFNLDAKYTIRQTEILIEREARATDSQRIGALILGAGFGFRF